MEAERRQHDDDDDDELMERNVADDESFHDNESDDDDEIMDDSDDEVLDHGEDGDDEDEFKVDFFLDDMLTDGFSGCQNVPDDLKVMVISGIKTDAHPLYEGLLAFLETNGRSWDCIYLEGDTEDDPAAFSAILLKCCLSKAGTLHVFGMHQQAYFHTLFDGLTSEDAGIRDLELAIRIPVTNQIMTLISQILSNGKSGAFKIGGDCAERGNAAILANGLRQNRSLVSLRFVWAEFEASGVETIFRSLEDLEQLRWLDYRSRLSLSLNEIGRIGTLLSSPSCNIRRLELWQNPQEPADEMNKLLERLSGTISNDCSTLKELRLRRLGFDDSSIQSLVQIMEKIPTLESLELEENRLADPSKLGALVSQSSIKTLHLRGNPILWSTRMWEVFLSAMRSNKSLEDFDINLRDANEDVKSLLVPKIAHLLCVNKAGSHRLVSHQVNQHLKLWPLVLERALQTPYKSSCRLMTEAQHHEPFWGYNKSQEKFRSVMQANAVYNILREGHVSF